MRCRQLAACDRSSTGCARRWRRKTACRCQAAAARGLSIGTDRHGSAVRLGCAGRVEPSRERMPQWLCPYGCATASAPAALANGLAYRLENHGCRQLPHAGNRAHVPCRRALKLRNGSLGNGLLRCVFRRGLAVSLRPMARVVLLPTVLVRRLPARSTARAPTAADVYRV